MEKRGLLSKHIVITQTQFRSSYPRRGLILIEGEIIQDIVFLDDDIPTGLIVDKYAEWGIEDYSDYYISPGLIDLNVRREFEDYTDMTQAALAGGVTFLLEEESYYSDNPPLGELYCDVGKVATIDISTIGELKQAKKSGCFAFKGYLYPPSSTIRCLPGNLEQVFAEVSSLNMPLFLDPNFPNPRMLYLASPLRLEHIEARARSTQPVRTSLFAAAFPEESKLSDVSEEEEDIESPEGDRRASNIFSISKLSFVNKPRSSSVEDAPEVCEAVKKPSRKPKKMKTLYDDLDQRIKKYSQNIETLSIAEQTTYDGAGVTSYRKSRSFDFSISPLSAASEEGLSLLERKKRQLGLGKIQTKTESVISHSIYNTHLANYPDSWELQGIEKALSGLSKHSCKLHICNISSSQSINKLRQSREQFPNLSCEIGVAHLYFSNEDIRPGDTRFKNNTVVRNQLNCNLVWELLKLKGIDVISSQHASIDPVYKCTETGNFQQALNGINTLGFSLQATWSVLNTPEATRSQLEQYLVRLSKWTSLNPAKVIQIADKRGSIEKGKFADLVLWKPYERVTVHEVWSGNPTMCPFSGLNIQGQICKVFIRGKLAFDQGCFFKAVGKKVVK